MLNNKIKNRIIEYSEKTPFFIYAEEPIKRQLDSLSDLSKIVKIYYAMKANPNLDVVEAIYNHQNITGVEIASVGEGKKFMQATKNHNLKSVIYTGPSKTYEDLKFVIDNKIKHLNIESLVEAYRINNYAKMTGYTQEILVRINTNFEIHGAIGNMSRAESPSQFGIDEDICIDMLNEIKKLPHLKIKGIHTFAATGVLDPKSLLQSVEYTFNLTHKIEKETGLSLKIIDFGGGFGIDYEGNSKFNVNQFTQLLSKIIKENSMEEKELVLELGRFTIADSGYFVTKINDIKTSKGRKLIICDAGINAHRRPYALKTKYPIEIIGLNQPKLFEKQESVNNELANIHGPLCTSADTLGTDRFVKKAEIGDLLVMKKSGAYGYSMSATNFLSNDKIIEIFIKK